MFSISTLFSLLSAAPEVIADVQELEATPQVQSLLSLINKNFTHTLTPGAASILEPIAPAPAPAPAPASAPEAPVSPKFP